MKIIEPKNKNYCATIVKIKTIIPLENCDNVVATPLFGFQAIINKETQIDDIGIIFPVETQLSEKYCKENNLFRHSELNKDADQKGYLDDNRRIKAMKFRGHRSDCLFMPLESLKYTGIKIEDLKEGMEFDQLQGEEICQKYIIKFNEPYNRLEKNKAVKFKRVDVKFLPEHYDSDNYFKYHDLIPEDKDIIVTQKLHGTSIRIGNTIVLRKLTLLDRFAKLIGIKVQETEFDYVFGSRKVIKDINNPNQNHYYKTDIWTEEGKKLEGILPQNFIVYAELIGWTPEGKPLQANYTYKIPETQCELYIYRIAFVSSQGRMIDLSWDQVKELCIELGLKYVPELFRGKKKNFNAEEYIDKRFFDNGLVQCLPLVDDTNIVDEGVCVRVDGLAPYILKAKSPIFLQHETKILDKGEADLESQQSI